MPSDYLRGVPQLTRRELREARQAEQHDPSRLAPRVAELARQIRARRPPNWAWQDTRPYRFAPLGEELAEAIVSHYRAGIEARVTARDLGLHIKTIRAHYRRLKRAGVRPDRGGREVYELPRAA